MVYLLRAICFVLNINLCDACQSQNLGAIIGLFLNANQARQFTFNIRLAVLKHFSIISCSRLGVAAADDLLP